MVSVGVSVGGVLLCVRCGGVYAQITFLGLRISGLKGLELDYGWNQLMDHEL